MKTKIITWLITLAAFLDIIYGVFVDNASVLAEIGVSPEVSKYILLAGILWNAFSEKLALKPKTE
jgi:hypothetical protein